VQPLLPRHLWGNPIAAGGAHNCPRPAAAPGNDKAAKPKVAKQEASKDEEAETKGDQAAEEEDDANDEEEEEEDEEGEEDEEEEEEDELVENDEETDQTPDATGKDTLWKKGGEDTM
jgi:hypothetical protein